MTEEDLQMYKKRREAELSMYFKECKSCGETTSAENMYCPNCGAKLPNETIADQHTCYKCHKVFAPGTTNCWLCGDVLPKYKEKPKEEVPAYESVDDSIDQEAGEAFYALASAFKKIFKK